MINLHALEESKQISPQTLARIMEAIADQESETPESGEAVFKISAQLSRSIAARTFNKARRQ